MLSPRGLDTSRFINDDLKSSLEMKKSISPSAKKMSRFSLQNRDSVISITEEEFVKIRQEAMKDMKKEYAGNHAIISNLKK